MKKNAFDETLAELQTLDCSAAGAQALVRKSLAGRSNLLAAKAARHVSRCGWRELIPDLIAAFDRFFENPVKTDAQCWAKNAISKALVELEVDEPALFIRGLHHRQLEPVWGGAEDTAGPLRAQCAQGLVGCRSLPDIEVLTHLTEALVDGDKTVRMEAARAVARIARTEGALLLRLRALSGESESEVMSVLFSSLLEMDRRQGIPFVSRFLEGDPERAEEAAIALGLTHEEEAFYALRNRLAIEKDAGIRSALLRGIALTRLPAGLELLLDMVESDRPYARDALEALALAAVSEETQSQIQKAVKQSGNPELLELHRKRLTRSAAPR